MTDAVTIGRIRAANARLAGHMRQTPLLSSPLLDRLSGRRVLVKAECLQHTGSFKYRGARAALTALSPELRARGVVAFSSGNHAQGVALAAAETGAPAVIVMPSDAPRIKIANTRDLGAEVVLYDRAKDDRDAIGAALAKARGLVLVRPYDDAEVIAGQGTCGLEIAASADAQGIEVADVLVPCGGGGLAAGVALALAADAPGLRLRTVEPASHDDTLRSLVAGRALPNVDPGPTICDAIVTPRPGELTFPILSRLAGPGLAITDDEALRAMALAWRFLKIVVEPGGAVALAAALFKPEFDGRTVICIASGGNVDADVFSRALKTL